tara:strand:+ start:2023 stop:3501 length:1479 start_codon:yes stop_codon:yes gene_type:complete
MPVKIGSLFSGIGSLDLGVIDALGGNAETVWFCESDSFCQKLLSKRFPGTPIYDDVTDLPRMKITSPDILVGGFPCQDLSVAGHGKGIKEGTRSGLFLDMWELAAFYLHPRFVLFENVPAITGRGLDVVTESIVKSGWTIEWFCLSASDVGAWHRRERWWAIAHKEELLFDGYDQIGFLNNSKWAPQQIDLFSPQSFDKLPKAGMATGNRLYSREQPVCKPGWFNTPNTMDHLPRREGEALERQLNRGNDGSKRQRSGNLREDPRLMWLTPCATNIQERSAESLKKREEWRNKGGRKTVPPGNLSEQVKFGYPIRDMRESKMWPTPTSTDYKDGGSEHSIRAQVKRKGNSVRLGSYVPAFQNELLPTPVRGDGHKLGSHSLSRFIESGGRRYSADDHRGTGEPIEWLPGKLNPDWVEPLMGLPSGFTDLEKDVSVEIINPSSWQDGSWEEGIPRLTERKDNRVNRVKALGNSVVPQCAAAAFSILKRRFRDE